MVVVSRSEFAQTNLCCMHAFCTMWEKNIQFNSVIMCIFCRNSGSLSPSGKVTFDRCSKMWSTHSSDRLLSEIWMENTGWSNRDYLWSAGAFVRAANMRGKGWLVPSGMLIPDIWMRRHPGLTLARSQGESFLKTVPPLDNILSLNMCDRCNQWAVNNRLQLSVFPEHSPNSVYKDGFPPQILVVILTLYVIDSSCLLFRCH